MHKCQLISYSYIPFYIPFSIPFSVRFPVPSHFFISYSAFCATRFFRVPISHTYSAIVFSILFHVYASITKYNTE